jgi:hypothetical protein
LKEYGHQQKTFRRKEITMKAKDFFRQFEIFMKSKTESGREFDGNRGKAKIALKDMPSAMGRILEKKIGEERLSYAGRQEDSAERCHVLHELCRFQWHQIHPSRNQEATFRKNGGQIQRCAASSTGRAASRSTSCRINSVGQG